LIVFLADFCSFPDFIRSLSNGFFGFFAMSQYAFMRESSSGGSGPLFFSAGPEGRDNK
jgi:hypothetical protein